MRRPLPPIEVEEHFSQLRQDLRSLRKTKPLTNTAAAELTTPSRSTQLHTSNALTLASTTHKQKAFFQQNSVAVTGRSASCIPTLYHTPDTSVLSSAVVGSTSPMSYVISPVNSDLEDPEESVESQRQALQTWIQHNAQEFSNVASNHVATELLLQQVLSFFKGKNFEKPNGLRLAAMCVVAENLVGSIGNYNHILRVVLDELYRSVYMSFGNRPREELISSTLTSKGLASKQYVALQKFLTRKPFFEAHEESAVITARYNETQQLLGGARTCARRVVVYLSDSWSQAYVRVVFCAWRGTSQRARNQTTLLTTYLTNASNRDALQSHFYAWRLSTKVTQLLRARELYSESIEQLVQQEAITNSKFVEADDQVEEFRLKISRLKEEKDHHKLDRDKFQAVAETSMIQAEGWRKITIETVLFLVSLRNHMATPLQIAGGSFVKISEEASAVLLEWVHRMVGPLPAAGKVRMSNFGPDMKDGSLLVLLMHAVTRGAFDEKVLQTHVDVRMRIQLILDYLQTLSLPIPFTIDDVFPPTHESNFLIVYTLWYFFESPVRSIMGIDPSNFSSLFSGRFREDLETMNKFLENAKSSYPKWIEQRSMLQQYASFVLLSQSKKIPVNLLSDYESTERDKEIQLFSILSTQQVPAAFLTSASLSPTQKYQNNEELLRINAVVAQHIGVLRHVFEAYSTKHTTVEASVAAQKAAAKPKKNTANNGAPLYTLPMSRTDADLFVDEFSFFRFCADIGLVTRQMEVADSNQNGANNKGGNTKPQRGNVQNTAATAAVTAPKQFSKAFLLELCQEISFKTSSNPSIDESKLSSTTFVSLLVNLAVYRYGQAVSSSTVQQIPASSFLETLIVSDIAPMIKQAVKRNAFLMEVFDRASQSVWESKRGLLQWGFKEKCVASAGMTMTATEWLEFLQTHLSGLFEGDAPRATEYAALVFEQSAVCLLPPVVVSPPTQNNPPSATKGYSGGAASKEASPPPEPEIVLIYGEFEIALSALAVMYNPSPFMSHKEKLDLFLPPLMDSLMKSYQRQRQAQQLQQADGSPM